jgi:hypothetical protein
METKKREQKQSDNDSLSSDERWQTKELKKKKRIKFQKVEKNYRSMHYGPGKVISLKNIDNLKKNIDNIKISHFFTLLYRFSPILSVGSMTTAHRVLIDCEFTST